MDQSTAFKLTSQAPHPVDVCDGCAVSHPVPLITMRRRPVEARVRFMIARSRARLEREITGPVVFPFGEDRGFSAEHQAVA